MGGSDAVCEVTRLTDPHAQINLQCSAGTITTTAIAANTQKPIFDVGVIPKSSDSFTYCSASAFTDAAKCSSFLDTKALEAKIVKECQGETRCTISDLRSFMPKEPAPTPVTPAVADTTTGGTNVQTAAQISSETFSGKTT